MATRIHKAYLQFSTLYREAATQAQYKALEAGGKPRFNEMPLGLPIPPICRYVQGAVIDMTPLKPIATRIVTMPADTVRDVLTKLMVLCHFCPDEPDVAHAMKALFGTDNRQGAIKALEAVIEKQPKGVATFVTIRDELKRFAA